MTGESEEVRDERECFTWCRMVIHPAQIGQDGFISDLFRWVEASRVITKPPFVSQFFLFLLPPPSSVLHDPLPKLPQMLYD